MDVMDDLDAATNVATSDGHHAAERDLYATRGAIRTWGRKAASRSHPPGETTSGIERTRHLDLVRCASDGCLRAGARLRVRSSTLDRPGRPRGVARVTTRNHRNGAETVAGLPISTWSYEAQGSDVRHIGPMAQDFARAFGVGDDERHITSIDADGVALAAIKGLNERVEALDGGSPTPGAGPEASGCRSRPPRCPHCGARLDHGGGARRGARAALERPPRRPAGRDLTSPGRAAGPPGPAVGSAAAPGRSLRAACFRFPGACKRVRHRATDTRCGRAPVATWRDVLVGQTLAFAA
jgi:hypothetical protein